MCAVALVACAVITPHIEAETRNLSAADGLAERTTRRGTCDRDFMRACWNCSYAIGNESLRRKHRLADLWDQEANTYGHVTPLIVSVTVPVLSSQR